MKKNHHSDDQQINEMDAQNINPFKEVVSTILYIGVIFVVFLLIRQFLFVPVSVDGASMEPTLQHEDRLILNKVANVDRFDIVVFPAPDDPEKQYIKRVIGLPGDSIHYEDDVLYINDRPVSEPYIDFLDEAIPEAESFTSDFSLDSVTHTDTVPDDYYFLLGDNRLNSKDSRSFGYIHEEDIIGETNFRIWPFQKIGFVNDMDEDTIFEQ